MNPVLRACSLRNSRSHRAQKPAIKRKHSVSEDLLQANHIPNVETMSPHTAAEKRLAPDSDPDDQRLDRPHMYKRVRVGEKEERAYTAPSNDGLEYNNISAHVRHLADQAALRNFREQTAVLTRQKDLMARELSESSRKAHQGILAAKLLNQDNKAKTSFKKRQRTWREQNILEERLDRAQLFKEMIEAKREKQLAQEEARKEVDRLQCAKMEMELALDLTNAGSGREKQQLRTEMAVLAEELEQAKEERDVAVLRAEQMASRDATVEFEQNEEIADLKVEKSQLEAALAEARNESKDSKQEFEELKVEMAILKTEFERWHGQTVPPKVVPVTDIMPPRPVKQKRTFDPQFVLAHPELFRPITTRQGPARVEISDSEDDEDWKKVYARFSKREVEGLKDRKHFHEEHAAANKSFEEGKHDDIPIGKVFRNFKEKEWASFSKGPNGEIRRAVVYEAQLDRENWSVHILPFPIPQGPFLGRKERITYACWCLTAQLPELQAEAAKSFLSEDEYHHFMVRSFGPEYQDLDLTSGDNGPEVWERTDYRYFYIKEENQVGPDLWQRTIDALRGSERFKTACRMWAAGEKALNQYRCWPPTFVSVEKTQACTVCNTEEEREETFMGGMRGVKRRIEEVEEDDGDEGPSKRQKEG